MFPFEKIKPFLVTNEDLKLVSLFGRRDCGLFGGKIQKRNEISLQRKKCKRNAKKLLDRPTTIRGLKKYTGDIRPLSVVCMNFSILTLKNEGKPCSFFNRCLIIRK